MEHFEESMGCDKALPEPMATSYQSDRMGTIKWNSDQMQNFPFKELHLEM